MELYLEACADIVAKQERYDKMKKKDGVNGFKLIEDISKLEAIIPVLESQKDVEEPLGKGAKSFLTSLYALVKYGKQSVFRDRGNKYTQKGKEAEDSSIAMVSVLESKLFEKHIGRLENDWIAGHPDVLDYNDDGEVMRVIDVKTPWDAESFFSIVGKDLLDQYYWQMQGYLALTNCQYGEVHFCLVNHPEHQVKTERDRLLRSMNVISELSPEFIESEKHLINNMTFDDMPLIERRIRFFVERNDEDLQKAYKQVEKCRIYLQEIEKMHLGVEETVTLMQIESE
jgi:hypothetical protein